LSLILALGGTVASFAIFAQLGVRLPTGPLIL
jgi:hypothetical protein